MSGPRPTPSILALRRDGSRTPVEGTGVIVAFGDGRELHVSFSDHPASEDGVMLRSEFLAPGAAPTPPVFGKLPDVLTDIVLRPGGGNCMQVGVEVVSRDGQSPAPDPTTPAGRPSRLSYFASVDDRRSAFDADSVAMLPGGGNALLVGWPDVGQRPGFVSFYAQPAADLDRTAPTPREGPSTWSHLTTSFGGCNVVHVTLHLSAGEPIRTIGDVVSIWLVQWQRAAGEHTRRRTLEVAGMFGAEVIDELIGRVSADDEDERNAAAEVGAGALTGRSVGLQPDATTEERAAAALRWRAWWSDVKARVEFDRAARRFVVR